MPATLRARRVRRDLWVLLLGVLCILSAAPAGFAQQAEIDALASRVAQEIAKAGKKSETKKVAVVDFVGVNGKSVPLGSWLADQFSAALTKAAPGLEIIDRAKVKATLGVQPPPKDSLGLNPREGNHLCDSVGANILVRGSLGPAEKAVGISLSSFDCLHHRVLQGAWVTGKIPLSREMKALLPDPPESLLLPGGVWTVGGGAGMPSCILCPAPTFPDKPVEKGEKHVVLIQITVTADGHATDISVVKSEGQEIDEKAIEAVRKWKFKPALGPDGTPVPMRTLIKTSFRSH